MGTGLRLDGSVFQDPFYHYRIDLEKGYKPQRFDENRVLWRDSSSFFSLHKKDQLSPPRIFYWLEKLIDADVLGDTYTGYYMALGMATKPGQAQVFFYTQEHLPIPASYLTSEKNVEKLSIALEATENVRSKLGGSLARLATLILSPTADDKDGRKPDKKDVQNLMGHWAAERHYWSALETPFFQLMRDLPERGEDAIDAWDLVLQKTAQETLEYACRMAGNDARALRATVRARGQLAGGLKKLFEED